MSGSDDLVDDATEPGPPEGTILHEFCIRGLHCTDCAKAVKSDLERREGVTKASVSMGSGRVCVTYQPDVIGPEAIEGAVRKLGYTIDGADEEGGEGSVMRSGELLATVVAGLLLGVGLVLDILFPSLLTLDATMVDLGVHHIVYLASMVSGGAYILRRTVRSLMGLTFTADGLMVVAAIGATAIGEMAEGAAVLFLFSLAELLEDLSAERNRSSLRALVGLAPTRVSLLRDGIEVETDVEEVRPGDVALVRPGERVPVDGVVQRGTSSVNEATITGEATPAIKGVGSPVFAGTMNVDGALEVRVSQLAHDTTLSRIISLVEEAEERRAPVERFVDRFARWYTPLVLLAAILVAIIPPLVFGADQGTWVYRALMLLVISCPCALAISVPVAVISAVTSGARRGILFKGGAYIELLSEVDVVAFDKTGTLTTGEPRLVDVVPVDGTSRQEVLGIAVAVEAGSEHHLAHAITAAAEAEGVRPVVVEAFQAVPGRGVEAWRANTGELVILGNPDWARQRGLQIDEVAFSDLSGRGRSVVVLSQGDTVLGLLAFSDTIRPRARESISGLGNRRTLLLSGDSKASAKAAAATVGISEAYAPLLPEEKLDMIRLLRADGHVVAMVGDGVNDAPSLAEADVGIAMGAIGSDVALDTADVVLMRDDIGLVPASFSLARRAMRVVRQNIVAAVSMKVALAVLVFMGLATLWMAVAIGDMGASLLVILNALRLAGSQKTGEDYRAVLEGGTSPSSREAPSAGY